jgi:hypothetical protein
MLSSGVPPACPVRDPGPMTEASFPVHVWPEMNVRRDEFMECVLLLCVETEFNFT